MAYELPAEGELDWHVKLNASIEAVKATADAAETPAGAQGKVDTHASDTVSVHGIADTAVLETASGAQAKVDAHVAATDPHGDRAYADGKFALLGHTHTTVQSLAADSRTVSDEYTAYPSGLTFMQAGSASGPWPGSGTTQSGLLTTVQVGNDTRTYQQFIDTTNPPRLFLRRWSSTGWTAWGEK